MFNEKRYYTALRELNNRIPYEETDYRNMCFASAFAHGRENELSDDRIRKCLLADVEDEFITYGQALTLAPMYRKAIDSIKAMF